MTIKEFIEKAIEGGWKCRGGFVPVSVIIRPSGAPNIDLKFFEPGENDKAWYQAVALEEILLDPEAWKAVGKVEGWKDAVCFACGQDKPCWCDTSDVFPKSDIAIGGWYFNMRSMIDALAEGKTIEEYLKTL